MLKERTVSLYLRREVVDFIKEREGTLSDCTVSRFTTCWLHVVKSGEVDLLTVMTEGETQQLVATLAQVVRQDGMTLEDFLTLENRQISSMAEVFGAGKEIARKSLALSEKAIFAIKERVCAVVPMATAQGGRVRKNR